MKYFKDFPSVFKWNIFYVLVNITLLNIVINYLLTECREYLPMAIMMLYTTFKDGHGLITKKLLKYYSYKMYIGLEVIIHSINLILLICYIYYKLEYLLYIILFMQLVTVLNFKVGGKVVYKLVEKSGYTLSDYAVNVESIYSISLITIGSLMAYITYKFKEFIPLLSIVAYIITLLCLLTLIIEYYRKKRM